MLTDGVIAKGKVSGVSGADPINGFKIKENRFVSDIRKEFFAMRMMRHWNWLPRNLVDAPFLEVLKIRLDGAFRNLVWWTVSLPMAGFGLDWTR